MKLQRNFIAGVMNKGVDERILPEGHYIDALNISVNSTDGAQTGPAKNIKGNSELTPNIKYQGSDITNGRCIGAFADDVNETIYWFVTSDQGDLILSYDTKSDSLRYHVEGDLGFDNQHLVASIDKIGDMLFFTDNLNPPRKINVTKTYVGLTQQELEERLLVIVKPPASAPTVEMTDVPGDDNYLEDRFASFAYRYKYENNEYSALSTFSDVAFQPNNFSFDAGRAENGGMRNKFNACNVTFNTGSSLVVGVDLCFKLADGGIVYVIQEFDKGSGILQDDTEHTVTFSNSKIYTTLDETEILRRYDNVPHRAQALLFIGNRLMLGNYEDGYDIATDQGAPIDVQFSSRLISKEINLEELDTTVVAGDAYTLDGTVTIHDSEFTVDLSSVSLKKGSRIGIDLNTQHRQFSGTLSGNPAASGTISLNLDFELPRDFANANALIASPEFKAAVGFPKGAAASTCGATDGTAGVSLTDNLVCGVPIPVDTDYTWTREAYGITASSKTAEDQGIKITENNNIVSFQLPAVVYETGNGNNLYEYFGVASVSATFQEVSDTRSLHSNRDYEVAIEYMDDYNRSTTAIVSPNNAVFVPPSASDLKNIIRVNIDSRPPYWATKYRFLVKRVQGSYETVYSNIFYRDVGSNSVFYKLDGQNQTKVKVGDDLIVKSDTSGPLNRLVKTQVLSIESKPLDFILPDDDTEVDELSGLYMELKPSGFGSVVPEDEYPVVDNGTGTAAALGGYPSVNYPCHVTSLGASGLGLKYDIPAGSVVSFDIEFSRKGKTQIIGPDNGIENYTFAKDFVAGVDYQDLHSFIVGEGITFTEGVHENTDPSGNNRNVFYSTIATSGTPGVGNNQLTSEDNVNKYQFFTDSSSRLFLGVISGTEGLDGLTKKYSRLNVKIVVNRAISLMVFETVPKDEDVDLFYEGSQVYSIANGLHQSGGGSDEQNQTNDEPAIVDLNFFDCFTFGNGVESYKANDALDGKSFGLGQRTSAVSQQDFKKTNRFADITYSGVFQGPANINRTNEFNLGLANFKTLEQQYGPIGVMHPRETDILVVQEDRISYVYVQKNLLSDSVGGGSVTSVPEVLGTQVARIEQFGTMNPESFSAFGSLKYFVDKKRGSVIELAGSGKNEAIDVISSKRLRSYFRDFFIEEFDQQILGGYDPYNNQYVLSSNTQKNKTETTTIDCGTDISVNSSSEPYSVFLDFGLFIGTMSIDYSVVGSVDFTLEYNGSSTTTSVSDSSGSLSFTKSLTYPRKAKLTVTPSGEATYDLKPVCPTVTDLSVYLVTIYSTADENKTIHNEFFWDISGINPSYVKKDDIKLTNDGGVVAQYELIQNPEGTGFSPISGSNVYVRSARDSGTFIFNENENEIKYLVSSTAYQKDDVGTGTNDLLDDPNLTTISNVSEVRDGVYQGNFVFNRSANNLYLIWDYRLSTPLDCSSVDVSGSTQGVYRMYVDTEDHTGAIVLNFSGDVFGVLAYFGDNTYSSLTSKNVGYLNGESGKATYIGDSADGNPEGTYNSSPANDYKVYDAGTTAFQSKGSLDYTVGSFQNETVSGGTGLSQIVIPKPDVLENNTLTVDIYVPLSGQSWNFKTSCPSALSSFQASIPLASDPCNYNGQIDQTYYLAKFDGETNSEPVVNNFVFQDANGQFPLISGVYKLTGSPCKYFAVGVGGVVTYVQ